MLKCFSINLFKKIHINYNALNVKKQALQKTHKSTEKENTVLNRKRDNLNQYLNSTPEHPATDRETEKVEISSELSSKNGVSQ